MVCYLAECHNKPNIRKSSVANLTSKLQIALFVLRSRKNIIRKEQKIIFLSRVIFASRSAFKDNEQKATIKGSTNDFLEK